MKVHVLLEPTTSGVKAVRGAAGPAKAITLTKLPTRISATSVDRLSGFTIRAGTFETFTEGRIGARNGPVTGRAWNHWETAAVTADGGEPGRPPASNSSEGQAVELECPTIRKGPCHLRPPSAAGRDANGPDARRSPRAQAPPAGGAEQEEHHRGRSLVLHRPALALAGDEDDARNNYKGHFMKCRGLVNPTGSEKRASGSHSQDGDTSRKNSRTRPELALFTASPGPKCRTLCPALLRLGRLPAKHASRSAGARSEQGRSDVRFGTPGPSQYQQKGSEGQKDLARRGDQPAYKSRDVGGLWLTDSGSSFT
ncbi:hypothetical protein CH63R_07078 [Colletotrichum higginsianum IMI 349063]|uniref:Uncharacterized protein n=1 Tax=Colletotrichum higginsianum (strain IMI 349063) TaxID=759273 RepID=A0A1B7Y8B3_COLHI|nr:hypothetical protein CH63R_07078 [Colletotrichum higginsianum IMI 349063]OBR08313.1 hypothetical protein CH63R_07078 [Colletotrichum higginsianum IMI 349063]